MKLNVLWCDYIIGELSFNNIEYTFQYINKETFKSINFKGIGEFKDLSRVYKDKNLFITFSTRLPNKNRKDIKKYLLDNGFKDKISDLQLLRLTKGILATDYIEICG